MLIIIVVVELQSLRSVCISGSSLSQASKNRAILFCLDDSFHFLLFTFLVQLATEESQNFRDRNIFIVLVPNKAVIQKEEAKKKETSVSEVSAKV